MESLSKKIGFKMAKDLGVEKDQGEVFAYGIFALMQMIISLLLLMIIGYFLGVALEAVIISIISSVLRKYSGGAHASKPSICIGIGTLICLFQALMVKYIIFPISNLVFMFIVTSISFYICYYLIFKYAPVDTVAKRIKTDSKRNRMKKLSLKILNINLIISIVLILTSIIFSNQKVYIYILCICIGILWQVFTLTKLAHLVFSKL